MDSKEKNKKVEQKDLNEKPIGIQEASEYCDLKVSTMYKKSSMNEVPHYKFNGKKLYFLRSELKNWLLQNKVSSNSELDIEANDFINKKRLGIN